MRKSITVAGKPSRIFAQKKHTVGLDLGDRWSWYCVLDEGGEVVFEHKLSTTPKAVREVFGAMPESGVGMETGTHSPWVSRLVKELGHEVIVAQARKVRLIGESRKKEDRLDARTLAAAGTHRSRVAGTDSASQCRGISGFDHDPGKSQLGAVADGIG